MTDMSKKTAMPGGHSGNLYMQTNEIQNAIVHYLLVRKRYAVRGGPGSDRRRRLRDVQADQRSRERAERLRERLKHLPHGGPALPVSPPMAVTTRSPASAWEMAAI